MTLEEHWRQLNSILRFAMEAGIEKEGDDGEIEVFPRWAEIQAHYEAE
jgi:hypothetical protein